MRRNVLTGALMAVLVAFGSPAAAVFAGGTSGLTWSGTWSRAEDGVNGNLILAESGSSVSGRYTWNDGSGTVAGSVDATGMVFSGAFNETNYKGSFVLTLAADGRSFTGGYTGTNKNTGGDISGPFDGQCGSGACTGNVPPFTPPPPGTPVASVVSISGEITVVHADGKEEPLIPGGALQRGDQLQTGVDAHVTLRFTDGSVMTVGEMVQLRVADLAVQGSRQNVMIAIKLGEVSAQVNPTKEYQTDFKVSTPSGTLSSRGTKFSVFANAATGTTIVRTTQHSVSFQPKRKGAKAVIVPAGKEILVTPTSVSRLAPIGKAGARGGIDMQVAADRVLALIDRAASGCQLAAATGTPTVRPGGTAAWTVTVAAPGQATSTWSVVRGTVNPTDARARTILAGCPLKAGHYAGTTDASLPLSLDVTADRAGIANFSGGSKVACTDLTTWTWTISFTSKVALTRDHRFSILYAGPLGTSSSATNITAAYVLSGQIDGSGHATGMFGITSISWDQGGAHHACTGEPVGWSAHS